MTYLTDPFAVPDLPPPGTRRSAADDRPDERGDEQPNDRSATDRQAPDHAEVAEPADAPTPTVDADDPTPTADATTPVVLTEPAEGLPDVIDTEHGLTDAARALQAGVGPLALDAERASGYRYGQRAYLVQLRREGSGTWLIDTVACPDLSPIQGATEGVEWILHAATQDLPCLREVGLTPTALFDTELGARLAGLPRVGLAAVVEHYLGVSLAKEHSAVDWSTRPLPEDWLRYAALDVELLTQVRTAMKADLESQGKGDWAAEEFDALTRFTGPPPRVDPWRRVTGLRKLRSPRLVAVLRELWYARDDLARSRDVSPGRVVPDPVLLALASAAPANAEQLRAAVSHRAVGRHADAWLAAIRRGLDTPESDLPPLSIPSEGPPPPRSWGDRDPLAAARLAHAKQSLTALAEHHNLPLENLLTPDLLRRVIWTPPEQLDEHSTRQALLDLGARPWQARIAAPVVAEAFATATPE